MQEPAVKKILYWCDHCNIPLIGKTCGCGADGRQIPLQQPYEIRPALSADIELISSLLDDKFGKVPIPKVILLNKTGGYDRSEIVIIHGQRFGFLTFDPVTRCYSLDITQDALPYLLPYINKGVINLETHLPQGGEKVRIGGKKFELTEKVPDGSVIVRYKKKLGTGIVKDGYIRVKEIGLVTPAVRPNPDWEEVITKNRYHLKNLERNALRMIKQHIHDRKTVNVSFSGGKDSTAVITLARKVGIDKAFFIDTGLEFPETIEFVREQGVEIISKAGDFWQAARKAGPPGKDLRWCCKLQKLHPLKIYLAEIGPCVTIQGNRWYESWNRADLDETSQNPANPLQLNISPVRSWRALEVFLYLWWQKVPINPLYDQGIERIGCYLCPAMLESELDKIRVTHPDLASRWDEFLSTWSAEKGLPKAYHEWGLWRWRALPPKMRELCKAMGIEVNSDFTLKTGMPRKVQEEKGMHALDKSGNKLKDENLHSAGFSASKIRSDFPILGEFVYLDNAATSFSPEQVVNALIEYEHRYRSNVGRGLHRLTRVATQRYWHAHEKIAQFIGGSDGLTVFTKNTTEAVNMVAHGITWRPGDKVVTTVLEHHSNLLPWRNLSSKGVSLDLVDIQDDFMLDISRLESLVKEGVRLVAVTHASNVLGVVTPVKEIAALCHEHGAMLLIDGAQSVPHMPVDLSSIGCDFFCFSGHKMLGPTGTGVLWMREASIDPLFLGGGMIEEVRSDGYTPAPGYQYYEAGTPNISGGIGIGVAADYLSAIGMDQIKVYEEALTERLIKGLNEIDNLKVYAPKDPANRIGVVSFIIEGINPHEIAHLLDEEHDILVRSGFHCCQPLMDYLGLQEGTVRVSLAPYTTIDEIDLCIAALDEISK